MADLGGGEQILLSHAIHTNTHMHVYVHIHVCMCVAAKGELINEAGGSPPSVGGLFMACLSGSDLERTSTPTHGLGFQRLGRLNFGDVGGKKGLGDTTATTRWQLRQMGVPPVLEVPFMACLS